MTDCQSISHNIHDTFQACYRATQQAFLNQSVANDQITVGQKNKAIEIREVLHIPEPTTTTTITSS